MGIKLDIVKWGNSAAVRLPATVLAQIDAKIGDAFEVDVDAANGSLTLRPARQKDSRHADASLAAIDYALKLGAGDGGIEFLSCWQEGDFESIRNEWPGAPEAVFIGADPSLIK